MNYQGFLFIGLMVVNGDPFVIEYNVRLGDPETEVILPRLRDDLLPLMAAEGFEGTGELDFDPRFACTVIAVSEGYPGTYEKGKPITGLNAINGDESLLFHAGTTQEGDRVLTSGGRVLALTSLGDDMEQALKKSYASMEKVSFEGMGYRTDIGFDLR
jgi:phosphoribosylamine--glycine ligase